jgi:hypothetical protein
MSVTWAASLPLDRAAEALRLWKEAGIEVCATSDRLWLRGNHWSDDLDLHFRSMLGAQRFGVDDQGLINPVSCALPVDCLPTGPWMRFKDWFALAVPPRHFAARQDSRVALRLIPSEHVQPVSILALSLAAWCDYAQMAPAVRLKQWSFAVNEDMQVIVRGTPCPPLPGSHFVETEGIAVPAGWSWSPPLDVAVIRSAFGLKEGDLLLMHHDGSHDMIAADEFAQATRSAVRFTARAMPC